jgi:DHA2 family multidrug resistance protein
VLVSHLTPYDPGYRDALASTAAMLHGRGASLPDATVQAQGLIYGNVQRQAGMLAFSDAFWVMGVLFLLIIPLMFMMKGSRPVKGPLVME